MVVTWAYASRMAMIEENWKVLTSLLPAGWRQMAWETGAVRRLREFRSPDTLLRTLMLHVAQGYSLRETAVRAKLAEWVDVSDVALLKRLRNGEEWLRSLCIELFRQNGVARLADAATAPIRIVDGTIAREPGKTGSQWRILYSLRLPSLICDFFDVTAVIGQGTGESLNRLPVVPHELILADAGYCSIAGIEHVRQQGADVLLRVNPQSFVPFSPQGSRISLLSRLRTLSKVGQCGEWRVILRGQDSSFEGRLCALRKNDNAVEQARRHSSTVASGRAPKRSIFLASQFRWRSRARPSPSDLLRFSEVCGNEKVVHFSDLLIAVNPGWRRRPEPDSGRPPLFAVAEISPSPSAKTNYHPEAK